MCLNTVEAKFDEDNDISGTGYKCFDIINGIINGAIYGQDYQIGEVNKDTNDFNLKANDYKSYRCGYHIFINLEDAKDLAGYWQCKVFKVSYKNVTANGTNETKDSLSRDTKYGLCVVAKEITILEQVVEEVQNEQTTKSPL